VLCYASKVKKLVLYLIMPILIYSAVYFTAIVQSGGTIASEVHIYYSLDEKQNDAHLIDVIDHAHSTIYFAIYTFTLSDVAAALVRAAKRGVKVQGIMDRGQSQIEAQAKIIRSLEKAGVKVVLDTHPQGIMHIKALVTDSAYALGSYNWTASATYYNDEILEIGTDSVLRAHYESIIREVITANSVGSTG
jgi:phosphatidylserine/phosphatidylglycerophosphate/cardiolipin synthase-like enzyme